MVGKQKWVDVAMPQFWLLTAQCLECGLQSSILLLSHSIVHRVVGGGR